MKKLKNKIAVITGAGSGIGRALAIQLDKEGCSLALNDKDEESLGETISLLRNKTSLYHEAFDVSDRQAFENFATATLDHHGHVDIVINNAGVALGNLTTDETTIEQFEWIFGINVWGVIYGTKLFLPNLMTRSEASIVNISSLFGIMGVGEQAAYCSTKFAVRGFTESLRAEMMDSGVTVSCVHPGGIKTNIARNAKGWKVPDKDRIVEKMENRAFRHTAEKAAKIIINGIKKKKERILIGEETYALDLLVRSQPVNYSKLVEKATKKLILE